MECTRNRSLVKIWEREILKLTWNLDGANAYESDAHTNLARYIPIRKRELE